jgi:hypothetical protein
VLDVRAETHGVEIDDEHHRLTAKRYPLIAGAAVANVIEQLPFAVARAPAVLPASDRGQFLSPVLRESPE